MVLLVAVHLVLVLPILLHLQLMLEPGIQQHGLIKLPHHEASDGAPDKAGEQQDQNHFRLGVLRVDDRGKKLMSDSQRRIHTSLARHPRLVCNYFLAKKSDTTTDKYICQDLFAQVVLGLVTTSTQIPNKKEPTTSLMQNLMISKLPLTPSGVLGTGMAVFPVTNQNKIAPRKAPTNWPSMFTQMYLDPLQTWAATESSGLRCPSVISAQSANPASREHDTRIASGGLEMSLLPKEAQPTPQAKIIVPRPSKIVILRSLFSMCAISVTKYLQII